MKHGYYRVKEWSPAVKQLGDELVLKIQQVVELEVLFMGSVALGLPGKNDIDLDILCESKDIKKYSKVLESVLGPPQEISEEMAVWNYMDGEIEIDCILSDPNRLNSHIPKQKKVFEYLKSNPDLCKKFRTLKYEWDGLPYEQYNAKKTDFFRKLEKL